MNKWSEIKQATLDKLFLTEEEARDQNYLEKFDVFANECLNSISNRVKPRIAMFKIKTTEKNELVTFPEDYISYADLVDYKDGVAEPDIIFLNWNQLVLPEVGEYCIFYNAQWKPIDDEDVETDRVLTIDPSIINCLPVYIASQVLAQDDIQRSTILKNEYELLLSGLDTTVMYQEKQFKSSGGWY